MDCEMTSLLQNAGDEEKEDDGQSNKIKYKVMCRPDLWFILVIVNPALPRVIIE